MTTNLLDLRQKSIEAPESLQRLCTYLALLVGEPFRLARVSYGDELTLHFGDLRPSRSPKLTKRMSGAYILGMRGSAWLLKAGTTARIISDGINPGDGLGTVGRKVSKADLERDPLIQPGSRVVSAEPFEVQPINGFGLQIRFSDGSSVVILPTPPEADEPGDEHLLPLADWELISPHGLLRADPGLQWAFEPSVRKQPPEVVRPLPG